MRQGGREGDLVPLSLVFLGVETALKVKSKTAASVEDTPSRRQSSKRAEGQRRFNIEKEDLINLIKQYPMTKVGKILGVSDTSVRKRCNTLGIEYKNL